MRGEQWEQWAGQKETLFPTFSALHPLKGSTVPLFRVTQCLQLPPRLYGQLLRREAHPLGPLKTVPYSVPFPLCVLHPRVELGDSAPAKAGRSKSLACPVGVHAWEQILLGKAVACNTPYWESRLSGHLKLLLVGRTAGSVGSWPLARAVPQNELRRNRPRC